MLIWPTVKATQCMILRKTYYYDCYDILLTASTQAVLKKLAYSETARLT